MPPLSPLPSVRRRADFLAANRGVRIVTPAFILLVSPNDAGESRTGFTASRGIGNAVKRNRARRRLREVARQVLSETAVPAADHIFIARRQESERSFAQLIADARAALARASRRLAR